MVFEAERTTLVDRQGALVGTLTIRDTTKPVTLDVTWNRSGPSPLPGNPYTAGMSARASLERSEFGMTYGLLDGLVGDDVDIVIEVEGQRQ